MKKLEFIKPFTCDILVFDIIGKHWIQRCLPENMVVRHLDLRDKYPLLLCVRFFVRLVQNLISYDRHLKGYRSQAILSALFDTINPRLIFTFADQSILVARYASQNKNIRVVMVQGALRGLYDMMFSSEVRHLPQYFALGRVEEAIFNTSGFRCKSYTPLGSVKLGLALAQYKPNSYAKFDLCFISHYRPNISTDSHSDKLVDKLYTNQRILFELLTDYAHDRDLSVVVISKTRNHNLQKQEEDYFASLSKTSSFEFILSDKLDNEFNSYHASLASDLILSPGSTLGFEMLGVGKKTLFGASIDRQLIGLWGLGPYFDALPSLLKLESPTRTSFFQHCDRIRSIPQDEYLELVRDSAYAIISMPKSKYPHQMLKDALVDLLQ